MSSSNPDAILSRMGGIIYANTVQHTVGFVLYGVYLVLFVKCMQMSLRHSLATKAAKIILFSMILLLFSSTMQYVADMIGLLTQVKMYLMRPDVPLSERRALWTAQYFPVKIVQNWPVCINYMVSDIMVIWRAWVLYPRKRALQTTLGIITFADLFMFVYAQALQSAHSINPKNPTTDKQIVTASSYISLGTNLIGTVLIGWKALKYHRVIAQHGDNTVGRRSRHEVTRILVILIETGLIFAVIQLLVAITGELTTTSLTPLDMTTNVIYKASVYLAAILPTATIIIIRSHRSLEDMQPATEASTLRFQPSDSSAPDNSMGSRAENSSGSEREKEKEKAEHTGKVLNITHIRKPSAGRDEMV